MEMEKILETGYMLRIIFSAIDLIFHNSKIGQTYNVGGNNEITNNQIANILIDKSLMKN